MQQHKMKEQNFLQGATVLTLCVVLVKLISAVYKIPLNNLIGSEGNAYFWQAYDIYNLLLVISTAGLPVAMSRMIAAAAARGNSAQVRRINSAALLLFSVLGVVGTLIMTAFCRQLAVGMGVPDGAVTFLALGPAVLFVCLNSSFRGYFQGHSIMTPSGVSEVIEALVKLILGLSLAYILRRVTGDIVLTVAGAILGVSVGAALAFVYLLIEYLRYVKADREEADDSVPDKSLKATILELLAVGIPITIGSAGLQIFSLIDSAMIMHRLQNAAGCTYEVAKSLRGMYGTAQTIFGLPGALVTPFTVTLIPAIAGSVEKGDHKGAAQAADSEIRVMSMIILPCAVGMGVLGQPIIHLLYSAYSAEEVVTTGNLLSILAVSVILNALVLLLNTILQAHNHVYVPVINMLIGGAVKAVINFILVGIPALNIYGAPIATCACFVTILVLDVISVRRLLQHPPRILPLMKKTIPACALMGVVAWGADKLLAMFLPARIACLGAIAAAVVLYVAELLVFKMLSYEDCILLPKGEKIAALLRLKKPEGEENA